MVSSQIYALFTVLLACLLCTSSSYLFSGVPCPRHAIRNCMSKVPSTGSSVYCKEAVDAIRCAVNVVRMCPDNMELLREMVAYNPLGLQRQVDSICSTR